MSDVDAMLAHPWVAEWIAAGKAETFKAGDSFVIPGGFAGTWETVQPVKKLYAIFEPKK